MKYTKATDGTITVTMSPDEADIVSLGLARTTIRPGSITRDHIIEMCATFEEAAHSRASHSPHAQIHDLFNDLNRLLLRADDEDGGNVMYRQTANMVDALHHAFNDFEDVSEQAARDLHG